MQNSSVSQFAHPRGALGLLAGSVMALENRRRNALAVAWLDPQPGEQLLEIGFGPGATVRLLAEVVADGLVAGVDSSAVMVAQARRRNRAAIRDGRVDLRHGSVALLPFADHQFDRALAVNSQHHWPHPVANLREVRRVLKPGGRIVITEQPVWEKCGADDCRFAAELAARLEAAGFEQIETSVNRARPAPIVRVRRVNRSRGVEESRSREERRQDGETASQQESSVVLPITPSPDDPMTLRPITLHPPLTSP